MARATPSERSKLRKRFEMGILKSPVYEMWDRAVSAYENLRGLNVGGAESGRRARAKAVGKYLDTMFRGERKAVSGLQRDMEADPARDKVMDVERLSAQVRPLPEYMQKRGKWRKK